MSFRKEEIQKIARSLHQHLEIEKSFGVEMAERHPSDYKKKKVSQKSSSLAQTIACLREEVAGCTKCGLHEGRTQTVFGEGSLQAQLMFVGEAPGFEEDQQGRPFVGRAGILLTKIIQAMGLKREEVYIANVLKCRPPGNRGPLPDEVFACSDYLKKQIDLIHPKFICSLGKYATYALLQKEEPISRLRGNFYTYQGTPVMPTYHPAYLLRNPSAKKEVWEDMKKLMAALKGDSD